MNHVTSKIYFREAFGAYLTPTNHRWVEYDIGAAYSGAPTYFSTLLPVIGRTSLDREHNQIYGSGYIDEVGPPYYMDIVRVDLATKTRHQIVTGTGSPLKHGYSAAWSELKGKVMVSTTGAAVATPPEGLFLVDYDDSGAEWSLPNSALQVKWAEVSIGSSPTAHGCYMTLGRGYESFGTAGNQTTNVCA